MAISQARSLSKKAKQIVDSNDYNPVLEEILNFLIIAGLVVELYLKAFMIIAREGRVTKGHDLEKLYREFPDFLKSAISKHYDENKILREKTIVEHAFLFSPTQPEKPDKNHEPKGVYSDFGLF